METCGAKNQSGDPCGLRAGWGTDHVGEGRCRFHGGLSTGPKDASGNKNAVTTGEHESIYADTLEAEERRLYEGLDTDPLNLLDEEIRLITIRIRRMMGRIQELKQEDFTVVERKSEEGFGPEGPVDKDTETSLATLGQIQDIEEALTRVQGKKRQLIKTKHQVLKAAEEGGELDDNIKKFLDRLEETRS